jgi:hypothetical protein
MNSPQALPVAKDFLRTDEARVANVPELSDINLLKTAGTAVTF